MLLHRDVSAFDERKLPCSHKSLAKAVKLKLETLAAVPRFLLDNVDVLASRDVSSRRSVSSERRPASF